MASAGTGRLARDRSFSAYLRCNPSSPNRAAFRSHVRIPDPDSLNFLAVGLGAALGAWARWLAGLWLNIESWPWGTLAVNLVGGYLIGLLLALVTAHPEWPACAFGRHHRLSGGLTTFSTFSAETVAMLERGAYGSALAMPPSAWQVRCC